jgi:hypothetical protein
MRKLFKYGTIRDNAKPGDPVRFVEGPSGQTGAIMTPRGPHEINAVLIHATGKVGYVELKQQLTTPAATGEVGSAGGVRINLPVTAGGSLKIS